MAPHRFIIPLFALLASCSTVPRLINEYKIDVQQGNILNQEMVSRLRPGLTKDQVRFILGTPVLMDIFHANRWDYIYRLRKGNTGEVEMHKFTVFFDETGKLERVAGDAEAALSSEQNGIIPESRNREIDLGSIELETEREKMPPPENKEPF